MFLRHVIAIGAAITTASAISAPVTYEFSGVVTRYVDRGALEEVASKVGIAFSGTYTIDLSQAEDTYWNRTIAGCQSMIAGVCTQDYGGGSSMIDWSLTVGDQTWTPFADIGGNYFQHSSNSTSNSKQIYATQSWWVASGTPTMLDSWGRTLNLFAGNFSSASAYGGNQLDAPDVSQAGYAELQFFDTGFTCRYVVNVGCWNTPVNDGYIIEGKITSWTIAGAAAEVPEPATMLLLGLGGVALVVSRKRTKESNLAVMS